MFKWEKLYFFVLFLFCIKTYKLIHIKVSHQECSTVNVSVLSSESSFDDRLTDFGIFCRLKIRLPVEAVTTLFRCTGFSVFTVFTYIAIDEV